MACSCLLNVISYNACMPHFVMNEPGLFHENIFFHANILIIMAMTESCLLSFHSNMWHFALELHIWIQGEISKFPSTIEFESEIQTQWAVFFHQVGLPVIFFLHLTEPFLKTFLLQLTSYGDLNYLCFYNLLKLILWSHCHVFRYFPSYIFYCLQLRCQNVSLKLKSYLLKVLQYDSHHTPAFSTSPRALQMLFCLVFSSL